MTEDFAPKKVATKFGRNLWRCRRRAALSQEELGARAALHRTEIGMLEHGTRLARVDTLMKIAGSLGISPAGAARRASTGPPAPAHEGGFSISERTLAHRRRDECS